MQMSFPFYYFSELVPLKAKFNLLNINGFFRMAKSFLKVKKTFNAIENVTPLFNRQVKI